MGVIKLRQREMEKAREHLGIAVKLEPNNWDYLYNLALVYEMSAEHALAIETYNKVLELNPEHKEAIKNLKMLKNSR